MPQGCTSTSLHIGRNFQNGCQAPRAAASFQTRNIVHIFGQRWAEIVIIPRPQGLKFRSYLSNSPVFVPCVQAISSTRLSRLRPLVLYIHNVTEEPRETYRQVHVRCEWSLQPDIVSGYTSFRAHNISVSVRTPGCHQTPKVKRLLSIRLCQWNAPPR